MSFTIIKRVPSPVSARRRVAAAVIAVTAVLWAAAGTAAAYTAVPFSLNAPTWSGNVCCGGVAAGWYDDAFGIVHLQGAVSQPVSGGSTLIGTLPAVARPNRAVFAIVHTYAGTYADLEIAPNGQITVIAPRAPERENLVYVSLEGVTYQPGSQLPTSPIEINQENWIQTWQPPNNSFGAANPAWYKDGSGIVHLEGATKQWNATPGGASKPDLVGAVPPAAAPARALVTIVHTFNGTYSLLEITPSGQIFAFGARSPGTTDLSFLSFEGVSYYPGALFNHVAVNAGSWQSCGGGQDPGWVGDNAGIIHLQGCALQTSSSGPDSNLVATLPAFIAPTRAVYTIDEAGAGEYADLEISPDGGIRVVGVPPATGVLSILNLEGITYQPSSAAGPRALSLTRSGEVLALLHKPRKLELIVFAVGTHAHLLGVVNLGHRPAGRSRIRWDLRVAGHRLRRGTYTAELAAVPRHGLTVGGPGVTFKRTYPTGPIRVLSSSCSLADAATGRC